MARVVVVGGGFAGSCVAVRLAKLRHDVVLVESTERVGGQLRGVTRGDGHWNLGPPTVTLPGVFRDLFRKSGRTIDREGIDLRPAPVRRHLLSDGTVLDLPFGTRGDQVEVLRDAGVADWSTWVDVMADPWNALRRAALDQVWDGRMDRTLRRQLRVRTSAAQAAESIDPRLRDVVLDPLRLSGDDPRRVPGFALLGTYLERNFSRWRFDGGLADVADVLEKRLGERRVDVRLGCAGVSIDSGVLTEAGHLPADVVVWCAPTAPRSGRWTRLTPRVPAARTLLRVDPGPDSACDDIFVHGPAGPVRAYRSHGDAWTVEHRDGHDPWPALRSAGFSRENVIESHRIDSDELSRLTHPGWVWSNWRTAARRPRDILDQTASLSGLASGYLAGAHAHPGPGLESAGMATAAIAAAIGPA